MKSNYLLRLRYSLLLCFKMIVLTLLQTFANPTTITITTNVVLQRINNNKQLRGNKTNGSKLLDKLIEIKNNSSNVQCLVKHISLIQQLMFSLFTVRKYYEEGKFFHVKVIREYFVYLLVK